MRKHLAGIAVAGLATFGVWSAAVLSGPDQQAFAQPSDTEVRGPTATPTPRPFSPVGLTRVHKASRDGFLTFTLQKPYQCDNKPHYRGKAQLVMHLVRELECDEAQAIPDKSVLRANGILSMRGDNFANFEGTFTLYGPPNASGVRPPLFTGGIELFHRIGTHHAGATVGQVGCEKCDQQNHIEGWVTGAAVTTARQKCQLRALITANCQWPTLPTPDQPQRTELRGSLDGKIVCPCPQPQPTG